MVIFIFFIRVNLDILITLLGEFYWLVSGEFFAFRLVIGFDGPTE